jgi:hypothetical protein
MSHLHGTDDGKGAAVETAEAMLTMGRGPGRAAPRGSAPRERLLARARAALAALAACALAALVALGVAAPALAEDGNGSGGGFV